MRWFFLIAAVTLPTFTGHAMARVDICNPSDMAPNAVLTCWMPEFEKRPYVLHLPRDYDPARPTPVIIALHGGGGSADAAARTSCPDGDVESPDCLHALAGREGMAVVYPNGSSARLLRKLRTWNAGGGNGQWQCVSGHACRNGVDDIAYFRALLADLSRRVGIDRRRVYATGLSNGAAMSHRLGCEMAESITAIAAVSGANQFSTVADCSPVRPLPVLQIHGTADACWAYEGGSNACAQRDGKLKASVSRTVADWVRANGCDASPATDALPDTVADGTRSLRETYGGCSGDATVVLIRVEGGGHGWPGGYAYLPERRIGPIARDFSASRVIVDFFKRHVTPAYGPADN
jgi:polyhydroxybutyrate depolymerase